MGAALQSVDASFLSQSILRTRKLESISPDDDEASSGGRLSRERAAPAPAVGEGGGAPPWPPQGTRRRRRSRLAWSRWTAGPRVLAWGRGGTEVREQQDTGDGDNMWTYFSEGDNIETWMKTPELGLSESPLSYVRGQHGSSVMWTKWVLCEGNNMGLV